MSVALRLNRRERGWRLNCEASAGVASRIENENVVGRFEHEHEHRCAEHEHD
jgi:hypothetical protein